MYEQNAQPLEKEKRERTHGPNSSLRTPPSVNQKKTGAPARGRFELEKPTGKSGEKSASQRGQKRREEPRPPLLLGGGVGVPSAEVSENMNCLESARLT